MRSVSLLVGLLTLAPAAVQSQQQFLAKVRQSYAIAPPLDSSLHHRASFLTPASNSKRAFAGAVVGMAIGLYVGYKYGESEANCGGDVNCGNHEVRDAIIGGLFGGIIGATALGDRANLLGHGGSSLRARQKRIAVFHSARF